MIKSDMGEKAMAVSRQSNIELLRILLAAGVIILHYQGGVGHGFSLADENSINYSAMMLMEYMFICAVDTFMIISGYFMATKLKVSLSKPFDIIVQLIVFELCFYFLKCAAGQGAFNTQGLMSALVPQNYFINLYCVTFVLSPWINKLLLSLDTRRLKQLVLVLFLLFSVHPFFIHIISELTSLNLRSASTRSLFGEQGGYDIINFAFCYILGASVRLGAIDIPKRWKCVALYIISCIGLCLIGGLDYHRPLVILEALAIFMIFKGLNVPQSKLINSLAGASLTVYLLHEPFVARAGVKLFVNAPLYAMLLHMLLVIVVIYLTSYVVHLIWNYITKLIFARIRLPQLSAE